MAPRISPLSDAYFARQADRSDFVPAVALGLLALAVAFVILVRPS